MLRNPYRADGSHHAGNKMALGNIRERLQLHFDAEASLETRVTRTATRCTSACPIARVNATPLHGATRVRRHRRARATAKPASRIRRCSDGAAHG